MNKILRNIDAGVRDGLARARVPVDRLCRSICTGRDGWTNRKRQACRETGLCPECRLLVKEAARKGKQYGKVHRVPS